MTGDVDVSDTGDCSTDNLINLLWSTLGKLPHFSAAVEAVSCIWVSATSGALAGVWDDCVFGLDAEVTTRALAFAWNRYLALLFHYYKLLLFQSSVFEELVIAD